MCGIFGITGIFDVDKAREALNLLTHRGPDDYGEFLSDDKTLYLGHRRLSIIDLDSGKQPIYNEDRTKVIVFNGCIYNYLEIARELRGYGHHFYTNTDTEVILHSYEQWGERCVERFNGMWAFAIYDTREKRLFCSRDRLGVKPFYYFLVDSQFAFASEIKSLLLFKRAVLNYEALRDYLVFQMMLDNNTLFKDIFKLEPGCNLLYDVSTNNYQVKRYWDIRFKIRADRD